MTQSAHENQQSSGLSLQLSVLRCSLWWVLFKELHSQPRREFGRHQGKKIEGSKVVEQAYAQYLRLRARARKRISDDGWGKFMGDVAVSAAQ
jgi:hypothetical protein